jgi:TonB-dependent starch-binding outer membrane protein SusC
MKTKYKWLYRLLLAFIMQFSFAQEKTITGIVSDASGPLPGVNVVIKGTTKGVSTGFDGGYSIKAKVGDVITFTYIGYSIVSKVVANQSVINVKLQDDTKIIEEVVVVGYGTQKKKDVTSSISKVKGSDIQGLVTPSFEGLLGGRAAGVQVTTATGIIGQAPRIRIRGFSSISSNNDPLYVVDGLPMYIGDIGGQANTNALGDINPADIESLEVLKDGSATAIYGSRAANGVIIITTKKGKIGDLKVNYNVVSGFASPTKTFDLLETPDFLVISNEKRTNAGQPAWAVGNQYNTDWQSAVLKNGAFQMDHNLSLSGGSEKIKYYLSMGYTEQDGIARANEMARATLRTNIEGKINKWITIGGNVSLTRTKYDGLNTGRGSLSGNIFNAIRQLPNTPIFDSSNPSGYNINLTTGNVGQGTNLVPVGDNISNIGYVLDKNKFESKINRSIVTTFLSADITKDINYKFQASADNAITGGFLYYDPIHGDGRGVNGRLQNDNFDRLRWNLQNILSYNKTFLDAHNISATAVTEYQKQKNQYISGVGTGLLDAFYNKNLILGAYSTQESSGSVTEEGIVSYIGRLSYNYKSRYFLQGSIRRDGLSRFAPDQRWNNFIGYSGGWNIANENFMKGISNIVSEFKLRASYSEVGNTEIGSGNINNGNYYPYLSLTSPSQYGTLNGIAPTQYGNSLLTWETSKKTDAGVDIGLFNNKLKLTFDYFNNDSDGVILQEPIQMSFGIPSNLVSKNVGKMNNKGYEFSFDYNIIDNSNLKWNINANLTLVKNKVISLPNNNIDIIGGSSTDVNIRPNIIVRTGESANSIYGFEYWGVNPANGNPVYYKADGSLIQGNTVAAGPIPANSYTLFNPNNPADNSIPAAALSQSDKKILGNTLPTYFGGFNSKLSYKNFDFNFLFKFSGGNKIFNATRRDLMNLNLNNNGTEILGRWQSKTNPGDGWTPRLYANQNTFLNQTSNATTRFLEDADFISLDNVSIGYKLPNSLIERIRVDLIRFYVQAQNMLIITKYKGLDPELETFGVDLNGTPRAKVISLGINVNL